MALVEIMNKAFLFQMLGRAKNDSDLQPSREEGAVL